MTYASPSVEFYDDGLVHSHDWSRSTPPGGNPADRTHQSVSHDRDETAGHDHRRSHA